MYMIMFFTCIYMYIDIYMCVCVCVMSCDVLYAFISCTDRFRGKPGVAKRRWMINFCCSLGEILQSFDDFNGKRNLFLMLPN